MQCLTPINIRDQKNGGMLTVPCSKCTNCKKRRASEWSFRLMQEDKISESSMFLTLTYDTSNVPITRAGFMSIRKRDLQLFFKRLRKAQSGDGVSNIKYYAVGEYGGRTYRPHYHVILFNCKTELIQDAWKFGSVHYGEVSGASVGYTLKYISKKSKIPLHRNDDRTPEFSLMSKGLGISYLSKKMVNWHKADLENRMYCNLTDGKKCAMPRYYKNKIYNEFEKLVAGEATKKRMLDSFEKEKEAVKGNVYRFRSEAHFLIEQQQLTNQKKGQKL